MSVLKDRIKKRTDEIIEHQKKQGWWKFMPNIEAAHKASLEADLKMAAMVDACIEIMEEQDSKIENLMKRVYGTPIQAQVDTVGGSS